MTFLIDAIERGCVSCHKALGFNCFIALITVIVLSMIPAAHKHYIEGLQLRNQLKFGSNLLNTTKKVYIDVSVAGVHE